MAQPTTSARIRRFTTTGRWSAAVTAGLGAGVLMGLLMQFLMGAMPMVGALYGVPTVTAGWIAHLVHSVVLALVFAAILTAGPTSRFGRTATGIVSLGLLYGALTWFALAGFVMPVWLGALGMPGVTVPNLTVPSLLAHLVYGGVLGVVYAVARAPTAGAREPAPAAEN